MGWNWHPPLQVSFVGQKMDSQERGEREGVEEQEEEPECTRQAKIEEYQGRAREEKEEGKADVPNAKVLAPVLRILSPIALSTSIRLAMFQNLQ